MAKIVRSIKHNFFINFRFSVFFKGSIGLLNLQNPVLYPVLYGLRFFYIPVSQILIRQHKTSISFICIFHKNKSAVVYYVV